MTGRLATIDLLRGVAVLLVIHEHVTSRYIALDWRLGHPLLLAPLTNGFYGVNLFFILSGFVLFLPYVQSPQLPPGGSDVGRFYRRRARRLLPLYYVSVAVAFLLWSRPAHGAWWELGLVATFLFQFSGLHFFPRLNPILWSLAVEVAFSFLLPVLAVVCLRVGPRRMVMMVVVLAMLTRWIGMVWVPSLPITDGVIGRLDDFVVGMAAAWVFVHRAPVQRPWLWIASGLVVIQLAFMASSALAVRGAWSTRAVLAPDLLSAGVFVLLHGMLAPTLAVGWRPLQLLGRMSYSLYLWHLILRDQMLPAAGQYPPAALLLYLLVLFGVSALTYRFVEFHHERDWRKLFLIARPTPAAGAR